MLSRFVHAESIAFVKAHLVDRFTKTEQLDQLVNDGAKRAKLKMSSCTSSAKTKKRKRGKAVGLPAHGAAGAGSVSVEYDDEEVDDAPVVDVANLRAAIGLLAAGARLEPLFSGVIDEDMNIHEPVTRRVVCVRYRICVLDVWIVCRTLGFGVAFGGMAGLLSSS